VSVHGSVRQAICRRPSRQRLNLKGTIPLVTEIHVPTIANAGPRLSIGRWFKRAGDPVTFDEPLVEINTDNVTHEIRAPITGVLSKVLVKDGGFVEVGTAVGIISSF
jgi:pyruvate/2-oxoglutarate dehydrogenase complex dihydrolipoamide acyltransferase (E2) component